MMLMMMLNSKFSCSRPVGLNKGHSASKRIAGVAVKLQCLVFVTLIKAADCDQTRRLRPNTAVLVKPLTSKNWALVEIGYSRSNEYRPNSNPLV